jgi:hypothetical protein
LARCTEEFRVTGRALSEGERRAGQIPLEDIEFLLERLRDAGGERWTAGKDIDAEYIDREEGETTRTAGWDVYEKIVRTRAGEIPRLKPLLDQYGRLKGFEFESPIELLGRRVDELYEHLLFQNLVPAFDDIPMRRVFPLCLYTPEPWTDQLETALQEVIRVSGCEVVREYPFLKGSGLHRVSLQSPERETRSQFERSHLQLAEQLVHALKESNISIVGNVIINVSAGTSAGSKAEPKDWTGKFKDLTEALKNMLLISASAVFLFDGTLIKSNAEPQKRHEISITQLDRNTELKALPKILDATNPEDFRETVGSLEIAKPPSTRPKPRTQGPSRGPRPPSAEKH